MSNPRAWAARLTVTGSSHGAGPARSALPTSDKVPRTLPRSRRLLFQTGVMVSMLVLAEGLAWLAISMLPHDLRRTNEFFEDQSRTVRLLLDEKRSRLTEIHPKLGWIYAAGYGNGSYQLNSEALRSTREYAAERPTHKLRIAAFGDSYVFGSEVDNPDAWTAKMEADDPEFEVLNYGVGGYGIDQSYLRYMLEGAEFEPRVVILGFTPDDIGRVVNVYRRFMSSRDLVLFKPRFIFNDQDQLTLLEAPFRSPEDYARLLADPQEVLRYRTHDYWYRPGIFENPVYDYSAGVRVASWMWNRTYRQRFDPERLYDGAAFSTTTTAFRINVVLFHMFDQAVRANGALPLVVMLPDLDSVRAARDGKPTRYEPLLRRLRANQHALLDAAEAFRSQPPLADEASWFAAQGHYSAEGNRIVASWLRQSVHEYVDRAALPPRDQ